MKKLIYSLSMLLLAGTMFSCQKEEAPTYDFNDPAAPKGSMSVTFALGEEASNEPMANTKAGDGATNKPATTFTAGDEVTILLFASNLATATVQSVKTVVIPAANADPVSATIVMQDIPVVTKSIMVMMNHETSGTESNVSGVATQQGLSTVLFAGKTEAQIEMLLAQRITPTSVVGGFELVAGSKAYFSPLNLFTSPREDVTIDPDGASPATVTLALSRIVSLFRAIIIDGTPIENPESYGKLELMNPKNGIMIRKGTQGYKFGKTIGTAFAEPGLEGVLHLGAFQKSDKGVGYVGSGTIITATTATGLPNVQTNAWQDFTILPNNDATENFEVVLGIFAKKGFIKGDGTPVVDGGEMLYFKGNVQNADDTKISKISPNKILKVTMTIVGGGSTEVPEETVDGDLSMVVNLSKWDDTTVDVDIEM